MILNIRYWLSTRLGVPLSFPTASVMLNPAGDGFGTFCRVLLFTLYDTMPRATMAVAAGTPSRMIYCSQILPPGMQFTAVPWSAAVVSHSKGFPLISACPETYARANA